MDDVAGRKPLRFAVMVAMGPEKMKDHFAEHLLSLFNFSLRKMPKNSQTSSLFVFFGKLSCHFFFGGGRPYFFCINVGPHMFLF